MALLDLKNRTDDSKLTYILDQFGNGRSFAEFSRFNKETLYAVAEYEDEFTVKLKLVYGKHVKKPKGPVECNTANAAGNSNDYVAVDVTCK